MIRKALFYSIAFAFAVLPLPAAALEVAGSFIQGAWSQAARYRVLAYSLMGKPYLSPPKGTLCSGLAEMSLQR